MRLVNFQRGGESRIGVQQPGGIVDLNELDPKLPKNMRQFLALADWERRAEKAVAGASARLVTDARLLAPVTDPQKVLCVGLNYADHARESGAAIPGEPVLFSKFPSALIGPGDTILLPSKLTQEVDYEAELVFVIGKRGRNVPKAQAFDYVAGYTCGHDVSARDWQLGKPGGQWMLGKTFDTFAPLGPALVTRDEVRDPHNLPIRLRRNGEVLQDSNTKQFIFKIDELVAYISQVMTLEPGDLVFTGTPPGVGFARKPPVFLRDGDVTDVEIEGVGVLSNPVRDA